MKAAAATGAPAGGNDIVKLVENLTRQSARRQIFIRTGELSLRLERRNG
jgi:hypothetical protein